MRLTARALTIVVCALLWAAQAHAQTADEVIEKHLAAVGGRAALSKVQTRVATGTIAVSAQGADLSGTIEIYNKAPNKARSFFKLDMSQLGMGEMVVDQRCDGKTAYASNSLQGDREITGNQLENMVNAHFPTSLLNYKEAGAKVELKGKEKFGERDAYLILFTPKAGSPVREYFDAQTYLLLRTVMTVDMPELGGASEQTVDIGDYKDVDGIKWPHTIKQFSGVQVVTIAVQKMEINKPVDDAMFARPAVK